MSSNDGSDLFAAILDADPRSTFAEAAAEFGFSKRNVRDGDGDKKAYEEVWATADERSAVHYVEDPVTGVTFLRVRGSLKKSNLSDFATRLDLLGMADAVDAAVDAETHDDRVRAVFRVAIVAPAFTGAAFEVFQAYATEPSDALLRRAALNAMAYRCWPECADLVEYVATSDTDAEVRETAARLLPYFRAVGQGPA